MRKLDGKVWVTSDTHFSHKKILGHYQRFYDNIADMNADIAKKWNEQVGDGDIVLHLGDVALGRVDDLPDLHGYKILVKGNHDYHRKFVWDIFDEVHDYLEVVHNGNMFILNHYPLVHWNRERHGTKMLYGHIHDDCYDIPGYRYSVCWDVHQELVDLEVFGKC